MRSTEGMSIDVLQVEVSGLGVRPRQATSDYVELSRFTLGNAHIDLAQRSIHVGEITLAGADVRGWLDQRGQLNLLQLLGAKAAAPTASRAPAWRIAAPDIRLADTRVALEDRGVKPAADLTLGPLSARITGYDSSPNDRITVSLQSAINGKGQLRLTAQGSLQPEALSAKLAVESARSAPAAAVLQQIHRAHAGQRPPEHQARSRSGRQWTAERFRRSRRRRPAHRR